MSAKQSDINNLRNKTSELEHSSKRLVEDKTFYEQEMHLKLDHSYNDCQRMRMEIDELRQLVNDRSRKNAELNTELDKEKELNDRRNHEISNLTRDLQARADVGLSLRKELEEIAYAGD